MDSQTQQFMYRWFIGTICLSIGGMFLYMFGVGIVHGDGEAVRVIDTLQPMLRDAFIALLAMTTGHQVVSAVLSRQQTAEAKATTATQGAADGQPVG